MIWLHCAVKKLEECAAVEKQLHDKIKVLNKKVHDAEHGRPQEHHQQVYMHAC